MNGVLEDDEGWHSGDDGRGSIVGSKGLRADAREKLLLSLD